LKSTIESLLQQAVTALQDKGILDDAVSANIQVTRTRDSTHGDFSTNLAMMLANPAGKPPRELAQQIIDAIPQDKAIQKTDIAGPGFINFFLDQGTSLDVVREILEKRDDYGTSDKGKGEKVQIEFVSANPTGPLHVGHGRGAAYGASVASLMRAVGYAVDCEYYVNDAGRQMNILAASVWLRYLQLNDIALSFPSNGYKGDYVNDIARTLIDDHGDIFVRDANAIFSDIPADEDDGGNKEKHIDALITRTRELLGTTDYQVLFKAGLDTIIEDIRDDLAEFGVPYENWYSEQSLADRDLIKKSVAQLEQNDYIYEKGGALWFRSTDFGDEKDRVVIRDNGEATYFASDIAYHVDKFARGYDRVINIWGADHHGYVTRVKAALNALGVDEEKLDILLVQFAILYRGKERLQMSTRSGSFVTLRELREEVGKDAARFFYVLRKCEQHMDFDLDLAKSQSSDNPVYYIQYAHARICQVMSQLAEKKYSHDAGIGDRHLVKLTEKHETELISKLAIYPDVLEKAAINAEPHSMAHYLRELANLFHTYYNAHQFIVEDGDLRNARLNLIIATRQVIKNGLLLLGVSAPESM